VACARTFSVGNLLLSISKLPPAAGKSPSQTTSVIIVGWIAGSSECMVAAANCTDWFPNTSRASFNLEIKRRVQMKERFKMVIRLCLFAVLVSIISSAAGVISCSNDQSQQEPVETPTSGKVAIYCDEAVAPLFDSLVRRFEFQYPEAQVELRSVAARQAVGKLLQGKARAIILCREYLHDEDSLLKAYQLNFPTITFAKDALVFYAHPSFPLDTISDQQLKQIFREGVPVEKLFGLEESVEIVFALGVGYLSQVALDSSVKMLRVGFVDTTGAYVYPTRYPHQSLIVLGLYPYVVPIRGILREDVRNLPWGVFMFLERDPEATMFYKDRGIVPTFAVIKIKVGESKK